ncbi:uracil-DNA glycosylase family protein [Inhella sp.]|uniref:uracil-DNA glycosylase n=1 Tax=Inhella sp. TaxID=1921806 RepID=UPI0035AD7EB6
MNWDARQTAMLEVMGLGVWPAASARSLPSPETFAIEPTAAEKSQAAVSIQSETGPAAPQASTSDSLPVKARVWANLDAVHAAVRECRACSLCEQRNQAVPGVGHSRAEWMVVGEAPGEQEDAQGEPFVGASGQLLDAMLAAVGRSRRPGTQQQQVFITNTVKCRPPGNRNPTSEEVSACDGFLQAQIGLVKPRMILALGRVAAQALLRDDSAVGRLRGRKHSLTDGTPVVVSYHPSYLLRQPMEKARAWEDLCLAMDLSEDLGRGP